MQKLIILQYVYVIFTVQYIQFDRNTYVHCINTQYELQGVSSTHTHTHTVLSNSSGTQITSKSQCFSGFLSTINPRKSWHITASFTVCIYDSKTLCSVSWNS